MQRGEAVLADVTIRAIKSSQMVFTSTLPETSLDGYKPFLTSRVRPPSHKMCRRGRWKGLAGDKENLQVGTRIDRAAEISGQLSVQPIKRAIDLPLSGVYKGKIGCENPSVSAV